MKKNKQQKTRAAGSTADADTPEVVVTAGSGSEQQESTQGMKLEGQAPVELKGEGAVAEPEEQPEEQETPDEPNTPAEVQAVGTAAEPEEQETPDEPNTPAEVQAVGASTTVAGASDAMSDVRSFRSKIESVKGKGKVNSGSKPRPNVTYQLLTRPPKWHRTPQVAQLEKILFDPQFVEKHTAPDGTVKVAEPDLFAQIEAGAKAGLLRTTQPPIRIFQYYRSELRKDDVLGWS